MCCRIPRSLWCLHGNWCFDGIVRSLLRDFADWGLLGEWVIIEALYWWTRLVPPSSVESTQMNPLDPTFQPVSPLLQMLIGPGTGFLAQMPDCRKFASKSKKCCTLVSRLYMWTPLPFPSRILCGYRHESWGSAETCMGRQLGMSSIMMSLSCCGGAITKLKEMKWRLET